MPDTPSYWMISNRNMESGEFGSKKGPLRYWVSDVGPLDVMSNWKPATAKEFKDLLVAAASEFPDVGHDDHESQHHVACFVHGYNEGWKDAAQRYEKLCGDLFRGDAGLGLCVSFDWPSKGSVLGYYPDRDEARECAGDFADVLSLLYDWLLDKQNEAINDPSAACKAKVSVISHSMGNYLLQKAMSAAWTRKNQPLLASLINQAVMVAADVDNDLFQSGSDDATDGNALANLTYRITALYSGRDSVLGASAGLKHFGARRLGRSGLSERPPTGKDNVWDVDCSGIFPRDLSGKKIHSGYFVTKGTLDLMRDLLRGIDRTVLSGAHAQSGASFG